MCEVFSAKEIQLKHRAPVLGIGIVDGTNIPLNEVTERSSEICGPHKVIIASEEQFKVSRRPETRACRYSHHSFAGKPLSSPSVTKLNLT